MNEEKKVLMRRRWLQRAPSSLLKPDVCNPFIHHLHLTTFDKIRIALMTVTIVPIRVVLFLLLFPLVYVLCRVALAGLTDQQLAREPFKGWRRMLLYPTWFVGRLQLFLLGFHYVSVKGQRASRDEAPISIITPHTGLFDILVIFVLGLPFTNTVSRQENGKLPLAGTLVRFLQPIFVSRSEPNSRQNASHEIERRAQPGSKWPQIQIFPEGTCTNGRCLINFKPGAFKPGLPIQPVALHYKNKLDTVVWTCMGPQMLASVWLTCCNFNNQLEVEFLPVYKPNEAEKKDSVLLSRNVRDVIAKALNLPVTDHSYEDIRLMKEAKKYGLPMEAAVVEFIKIVDNLGLNFSDIQEQLPKYAEIAKSKGYINIEDFADYLKLPISPALQDVFAMYDRDGSGSIDFREYVIGCSLIAKPAQNEETMTLALKRFGGKCYITKEELIQILESSFTMTDDQAEQLFNQLDVDNTGKITYDQFKAYADKKPEYATLFNMYQELNKTENSWKETDSSIDSGKKTD